MRAFLAIDMPSHALDALEILQGGLSVGRLSPRETMHLTLAFLGEQPDRLIADADEALLGLDAPGFDLHLAGLDTFGTAAPGILFVGATKNPALDQLQRKVRGCLRSIGLDLRRERFRPHVTLARFARGLSLAETERLADFLARNAAFGLEPFTVRGFSLFRSTLHPDGPVHEELAFYPLH